MSFINHLIKRAKEAPAGAVLDVPASKVGTVVEHVIGCEGMAYGDRDAVRKWLLAGQIALLGCRLRVIGQQPSNPEPRLVCEPLYGEKRLIPYWRDPDHPKIVVIE